MKIAGAPISWGVCEVPGWGYQLTPNACSPRCATSGLSATELGPEGFLPSDPAELTALLDSYGLQLRRPVRSGGAARRRTTIRCPTSPARSTRWWRAGPMCSCWRPRPAPTDTTHGPTLDDRQWATLLANLDRLAEAAADRGVLAVLHPHVGTMVENRSEVERVLAGSAIRLCLDTGHLLIGGTDPLQLAREVPDRIAHAHLKDVDANLAADVQAGRLTYTEAVARGMYTPLGAGDVDIAGIVTALRSNGYDGWFVMEQDTILDGEPRR